MTAPDPRLVALSGLAVTLREVRLAALQMAEARRRVLAEELERLPRGAAMEADCPAALASAQARWIPQERARRSAAVAAATAEAMEARDRAAQALGRAEALRRLAGLPR